MKPATITIGKLRDGLSAQLRRVKRGEALVVLDRNVPVARIVPFEPADHDADADHRDLVAQGVLRAPTAAVGWKRIEKMPTAKVAGNAALAALLRNRDEDRY